MLEKVTDDPWVSSDTLPRGKRALLPDGAQPRPSWRVSTLHEHLWRLPTLASLRSSVPPKSGGTGREGQPAGVPMCANVPTAEWHSLKALNIPTTEHLSDFVRLIASGSLTQEAPGTTLGG